MLLLWGVEAPVTSHSAQLLPQLPQFLMQGSVGSVSAHHDRFSALRHRSYHSAYNEAFGNPILIVYSMELLYTM